jgi:hypothetical protein
MHNYSCVQITTAGQKPLVLPLSYAKRMKGENNVITCETVPEVA